MKNFSACLPSSPLPGSDIGRALAQDLAEKGCKLALSDIRLESVKGSAKLCECFTRDVFVDVLEVADKKAMQTYPEKVVQQFGGVNIVINNTAWLLRRPSKKRALKTTSGSWLSTGGGFSTVRNFFYPIYKRPAKRIS